MSRYSSPICLWCEARSVLRAARQSWQSPSQPLSLRNASTATFERKRPSRMSLSPRVAQSSPKPVAGGKPANRRPNDGPFGGMNITEAKIRNQGVNRTSQAEERRASRYKQARPGHGGKNERSKPEAFKALKMQRALSPVSYSHRSSVKQSIAATDSFDAFDFLPEVQEAIIPQALHGLSNVSPTPIQRLAIPALLGHGKKVRRRAVPADSQATMEQFLLAAETGSGKTLAYLLPIIDAIKRAEIVDKEREAAEAAQKEAKRRANMFALESPPLSNDPHPTTGRPRAIILLPTSELVNQVGALAKSLSHSIKFRAAMISASYTGTVIRSRLFSPQGIDLLICTPHLLNSITESDPNVLSRVTHLVVDEADSLWDRSFAPITGSILDRATPSLRQLILCSATIPRSLDSYLHKRFPSIQRLATPNLHAIPRRVQLAVVDVEKDPYKGNKDLACADTIWSIGREAAAATGIIDADTEAEDARDPVKRMLVFVNEREKTAELAEYLRSKGVDAVALNRDATERKQAELLAPFVGGPEAAKVAAAARPSFPPAAAALDPSAAADADTYQPMLPPGEVRKTPLPPPRRHLANVKVLVMTDLGSRGIDTLLVRHVVLYDVPHTSIDFIHRLGRVGRMGRRGRGIVLVGKGDRRDVVREVREGMFKGQALI